MAIQTEAKAMSEHSKTWRVKWRSFTGATGYGAELYYKHDAERWANEANRDPKCRGIVSDIEDTKP